MVADISIMGLVYTLLLVLPLLLAVKLLKLNLGKSIVIAVSRMVIQLSLVGIYLQYIFKWDNIYINIGYLFMMGGVSAWTVGTQTRIKREKIFFIVFFTTLVPVILILLYLNYIVIRSGSPFLARFCIPFGGLILGNLLRSNIICLNAFFNGFLNREEEYLYSLTLGGTKFESLLPFIQEGILAFMGPTIAGMVTIGLVALPGIMTGQILGGSLPLTAIKYQIIVSFTLMVVKFFSPLLTLLIISKLHFDEYHMLKKEVLK